jgi:hypothetical protein
MENNTNAGIAAKPGRARASVEHRLRLIPKVWKKERPP